MKKVQDFCALLAALWASIAVAAFYYLGNGMEITHADQQMSYGIYTVSRGVLFLIAGATILSLAALVLAIVRLRRGVP